MYKGRPSRTEKKILTCLNAKGEPMYGAQIARDADLPDWMRSGEVYCILSRMCDYGLIAPAGMADSNGSPGAPRKLYTITDLGKEKCA